MNSYPYIFIKIHEVGYNFDIWMINSSLTYNFFKHITNTSRKYEHRDTVLMKFTKEILISFPASGDRVVMSKVDFSLSLLLRKHKTKIFLPTSANHILILKQ